MMQDRTLQSEAAGGMAADKPCVFTRLSWLAPFATLAAIVALGLWFVSQPAHAAEGETHMEHVDWSFDGVFGRYDPNQLRRGYKVYKSVCASCHSMDYVAFRNLKDEGGPMFTEEQAAAIAAEYTVVDGPNADGEMFERPAELKDAFPAPYPNDQAASAANGGALPPDLSLLAKARKGGADYIYSLMIGYEDPPEGEELSPGLYYNNAFPGHAIAMPPPLAEGIVEYEGGPDATVEQMAKDVSAFTMWAAEPKLDERKRTGFVVLIYLSVLAVLLYFTTRKLWSKVH